MRSLGAVALFHLVGLTPEAGRLHDIACADLPNYRVTRADIDALRSSYCADGRVDVVVFSAPQLSLYELRDLAGLCSGRRFVIPLLAGASPQIQPDADPLGDTFRIETGGGAGVLWEGLFLSLSRRIAECTVV